MNPETNPKEAALALLWGVSAVLVDVQPIIRPEVELMPGKDMQDAYDLYRSGATPAQWNTPEGKHVFAKLCEAPATGFGRMQQKLQDFSWKIGALEQLALAAAAPLLGPEEQQTAVFPSSWNGAGGDVQLLDQVTARVAGCEANFSELKIQVIANTKDISVFKGYHLAGEAGLNFSPAVKRLSRDEAPRQSQRGSNHSSIKRKQTLSASSSLTSLQDGVTATPRELFGLCETNYGCRTPSTDEEEDEEEEDDDGELWQDERPPLDVTGPSL